MAEGERCNAESAVEVPDLDVVDGSGDEMPDDIGSDMLDGGWAVEEGNFNGRIATDLVGGVVLMRVCVAEMTATESTAAAADSGRADEAALLRGMRAWGFGHGFLRGKRKRVKKEKAQLLAAPSISIVGFFRVIL